MLSHQLVVKTSGGKLQVGAAGHQQRTRGDRPHLDDFPAFEFILGLNRGLANLFDMEEIWREEWECAAEHEPDGSSQSHCTRR